MYFGLYEPAPIKEEAGVGYFIPAHPVPLDRAPSFLEVLLGARYSLIGNWTKDAYRSGVDSFRVLRRQVVLANSPTAVKYVMVTRHANFERKSPQMRRALELLLGDGLFISDGETWKRRRPLVADIIHKRRLPEFAPTMEQVAEGFTRRWAGLAPDCEVELTTEMAALTAEIIARTVFGRNLGRAAADEVIHGFTTYQRSVDSFNLGYWLGADEGWPVHQSSSLRAGYTEVHRVVERIIGDHLAGAGDPGSMVDLMIRRNRRNSDLALNVAALRNEAATIFMAGHETTATTLTWALYCLAHAPWIEALVQDEVDQVCGTSPVRMSDLARLTWCRCVIQEVLRLYPPVPLLPRQAHDRDEIDSFQIEKGSLVMIAPWLLHRAADLWDEPNHFRPERFAEGSKIDPFVYIPFSVGPRVCAGMNFGLNEAVFCLAVISQQFRVTPRAGYAVNPVCRLTLRPNGGLPVRFQRRKH